jgi:hypothetical protein
MRALFNQLLAKFFLITSLLPLFCTGFAGAAHGASHFYWDFINVDIDVQENGNMLVRETQKYVFTAPHSSQRYRWIPLDKADRIDQVEVFEEGKKLAAATGIKNNRLWIKWRHSLHPPESHTFVIKYRVKGGLHVNDDKDMVYWKAIFKKRSAPIQSGKVIVRLPDSLSGKISSFKSFGVSASAERIDDRTVKFVSHGALPPGRELEVQVAFPHGILSMQTPKWQQKAFLMPLIKSLGIELCLWIILFVFGAVSMFFVVRRIQEWKKHYFFNNRQKEETP